MDIVNSIFTIWIYPIVWAVIAVMVYFDHRKRHYKRRKSKKFMIRKYAIVTPIIVVGLVLLIIFGRHLIFFEDVIIVTITIFAYKIAKDLNYYNTVLLILLGINLLVVSDTFLDPDTRWSNVLFAISTGIIVTGVINMFSDLRKYYERRTL